MNQPEILLQKYLDGKCTPEEKKELYFHLRQAKVQDFDQVLHALWQEVAEAGETDKLSSDRMFREISRQVQGEAKEVSMLSSTYLWIAASLTGLLLLCGGLYFFYVNRDMTFSTEYGEVKTLVLPDQTKVYLNANSEISYAKTLDEKTVREVWLKGEAYFEVNKLTVKRSNGTVFKSFIVHTDQIDIEVLGTEFNVKNRLGETEVVLDEGKIQLSSFDGSREKMPMVPGEKALISDTKKLAIAPVEEPQHYSSWKQNELYFEQVKLGKIAKELENNFGIQISFDKPETAGLLFTGSAPADDLEVLFLTIEKSFNLKIHKKNDGYYITAPE